MHVRTKKNSLHYLKTIFMNSQGATLKNVPFGARFDYKLIILSELNNFE